MFFDGKEKAAGLVPKGPIRRRKIRASPREKDSTIAGAGGRDVLIWD